MLFKGTFVLTTSLTILRQLQSCCHPLLGLVLHVLGFPVLPAGAGSTFMSSISKVCDLLNCLGCIYVNILRYLLGPVTLYAIICIIIVCCQKSCYLLPFIIKWCSLHRKCYLLGPVAYSVLPKSK